MRQKLLTVPCKIRRAAFSGERIVQFRLGGSELKTIAPVHYCRTGNGEELTELMPAPGRDLDGTIKVLASISDASVVVDLPDGEFLKLLPKDVEDLLAS